MTNGRDRHGAVPARNPPRLCRSPCPGGDGAEMGRHKRVDRQDDRRRRVRVPRRPARWRGVGDRGAPVRRRVHGDRRPVRRDQGTPRRVLYRQRRRPGRGPGVGQTRRGRPTAADRGPPVLRWGPQRRDRRQRQRSRSRGDLARRVRRTVTGVIIMTRYLRYPHLARDLITFTAEDDVWLASLSEATDGRGTRAWRLTADRAPVLHPRLNPSATHVAWTSTRDGTRSLHRGAPREAYAVPTGDGTVRDGAVLVGSALETHLYDPAQWKRYRGGTGGKIWYSPDGSHYTRIFADVGNHLVNPMFVGPRVVFLSDHEGTGALYSALPDGTDLRRHTDLGQYYARHATTDGQRVIYQRAGEIWLLESLDAEPVRLDIRLGAGSSGRAPYPVSAKSQLGAFTLDATGQVLGAEVRGTVHRLPVGDGPARALLAEPGVRGRLPVVIPGSGAVACTSDKGGEDGLDVIPPDGSAARRIGHGEFGRILELAVAPDGRLAAVACADGRLLTVALEGEPVVAEIARNANEAVTGLAFSPDSALLAWSQPWLTERGASQIRLARLGDGMVTDVTPPRFDDTSPAFTLDGKYLAFLSNRAFDPVYDPHQL